jgi:hypothetical protein
MDDAQTLRSCLYGAPSAESDHPRLSPTNPDYHQFEFPPDLDAPIPYREAAVLVSVYTGSRSALHDWCRPIIGFVNGHGATFGFLGQIELLFFREQLIQSSFLFGCVFEENRSNNVGYSLGGNVRSTTFL